MKLAAIVCLICALVLVPRSAEPHTRSQSHSVWEINGQFVDAVLTIPDIEADRLATEATPVTSARVRDYLVQKTYAIANGKRCALIPPVEELSALSGFRKYDFTFKCDSAANLQIHSGAFFDLVAS